MASSSSNAPLPSEEERFSHNARVLTQTICTEICTLQDQGYLGNIPTFILKIMPSVISGFNPEELINGFITKSYEHWQEIYEKNLIFFVDHADEIFASRLPVENVNMFKNIFSDHRQDGTPMLMGDVIAKIWNAFHAMVKISIKYVHRKRCPEIYYNSEGKQVYRYSKKFMEEIDVPAEATKWGIKLSPF